MIHRIIHAIFTGDVGRSRGAPRAPNPRFQKTDQRRAKRQACLSKLSATSSHPQIFRREKSVPDQSLNFQSRAWKLSATPNEIGRRAGPFVRLTRSNASSPTAHLRTGKLCWSWSIVSMHRPASTASTATPSWSSFLLFSHFTTHW